MKAPVCYSGSCQVSHLMLETYDPYIEVWNILNSRTSTEAGLAGKVFDWLNMTPEDYQALIVIDCAFQTAETERRKKSG